MKDLPNKASELIRLAISDLEKIESNPNYIIDMNEAWHSPTDMNKCFVCLAGTVMANTLELDSNLDIVPHGNVHEDKFHALNEFRLGNITTGLAHMNINCDVFGEDCWEGYLVSYSLNKKLFKQQMLDLADILEVEGF